MGGKTSPTLDNGAEGSVTHINELLSINPIDRESIYGAKRRKFRTAEPRPERLAHDEASEVRRRRSPRHFIEALKGKHATNSIRNPDLLMPSP